MSRSRDIEWYQRKQVRIREVRFWL